MLKSDIVALESDPATWLEEDLKENKTSGYSYVPDGFYSKSFLMNNPQTEDLGAFLSLEDRVLNGLLYRTNSSNQDFEEEETVVFLKNQSNIFLFCFFGKLSFVFFHFIFLTNIF